MAEEPKGFGEQLFSRLQGQGLSRGQVYKVLALQRLDPDVADLGAQGLLTEAQLLQISRIAAAPRQKQLAELAIEKHLPASWVKDLSRLIRSAEKARSDVEANRIWDFFFHIRNRIEKEGCARALQAELRGFDPVQGAPPGEAAEGGERRVVSFSKMDLVPGRGLDVGTVNICSAARTRDGRVVYNIQRDAFLDMRNEQFTRKMLMKLGIDYFVQGDKGYVIGDSAFDLAQVFEKNTRRPMKDGMISPLEPEALLIVGLLIAQLLGHPQQQGEICSFSVPADPIDADRNIIYHRGTLESVLRKIGYTPKAMLEGHAVVFAELAPQDYTGIGISCGGGMFNVCVAYKSVPALSFATSRGGDWVDINVGTAVGLPSSLACAEKERGVDLLRPRDRIQEAIAIYYRNLIHYTLLTIKERLESAQNLPSFSKPVDLVCAGGTSLVGNFIEVFREEFHKVNFPLEVAQIRLARDPLRSVAEGCLQAAIEETQSMKEAPISVAPAALQRSGITGTGQATKDTRRMMAPAPADSVTDRAQPTTVAPAPADSVTDRAQPTTVAPAPAILPDEPAPEPAVPFEEIQPAPPPEPAREALEDILEAGDRESDEAPGEEPRDFPLIS